MPQVDRTEIEGEDRWLAEHGYDAVSVRVVESPQHLQSECDALRRRQWPAQDLRELAPLEQEGPRPLEHLIDLVHSLVCMQSMLLPGLEAVESHQDPLGLEEGEPAAGEDGHVIAELDHRLDHGVDVDVLATGVGRPSGGPRGHAVYR